MKLNEIETIGRKVLQAALDEGGQIGGVVACACVRIEAAAGFGSDDDFFAAFAFELREQAFAAAVAVDIGGIEEVDAEIYGAVERGERFLIIDRAPGAADGPGAETDC